jgi:tRNA threonylcarbamoyladenosine biosynthesis protein TsaE
VLEFFQHPLYFFLKSRYDETMKSFITNTAKQTQKLGELLAQEIRGGKIVALYGELGSGKTTFTQGFLKGMGAKGPYTSPTFLVIKNYKKEFPISKSPALTSRRRGEQFLNKSRKLKFKIQNIYHIDAYRVTAKDILNLGWKEIISNKNNIVIIEWADRIKKIIPPSAFWIIFSHYNENKRKIIFKRK